MSAGEIAHRSSEFIYEGSSYPALGGDASTTQNGKMRPGQVASLLSRTADPQACPNTLPTTPDNYLSSTGVDSGPVQECQGGAGHNSWYGNGQVDALNAIGSSAAFSGGAPPARPWPCSPRRFLPCGDDVSGTLFV